MESAKYAAELGKIFKYIKKLEENLAIFTAILMAAFETKKKNYIFFTISYLGKMLCR